MARGNSATPRPEPQAPAAEQPRAEKPAAAEQAAVQRPRLSAITHHDLLMNGRAVDINTGGVWTRDPVTGEISYAPPGRAEPAEEVAADGMGTGLPDVDAGESLPPAG